MSKLPRSLSIGLRFAGSLFFVGILYYYFEMDPQILAAVALLGLAGALTEWFTGGKRPRT